MSAVARDNMCDVIDLGVADPTEYEGQRYVRA